MLEDFLPVYVSECLGNDGIADLSHEDHETRRGVIEPRVFPDQKNVLQDRLEKVFDGCEVYSIIHQP